MICLNPFKRKKGYLWGLECVANKERTQCSVIAIKALKAKRHAMPTHSASLSLPTEVKGDRARELYIIFPASQPLGWIFKSWLYSQQSTSPRATLGTHQCHSPITHQGLFQRCRQSQPPARMSLVSKPCPLPNTKENKSGLWKLGVGTYFSGYIICWLWKGGLKAKFTPRDTSHGPPVLL